MKNLYQYYKEYHPTKRGTSLKVLLTGFEPFGGRNTNPSKEVVLSLSKENLEGVELSTMILPVDFHQATKLIKTQVEHYDYIIMLGAAFARDKICVEKIAINLMNTKSGDNSGFSPTNVPIYTNASYYLFTNAPTEQIVSTLNQAGYDCQLSNSAGTYVCNAIYYTALHEIICNQLSTKAIFIHIPSDKCMSISTKIEAIKTVLQSIHI